MVIIHSNIHNYVNYFTRKILLLTSFDDSEVGTKHSCFILSDASYCGGILKYISALISLWDKRNAASKIMMVGEDRVIEKRSTFSFGNQEEIEMNGPSMN